MNSKKIPCGQKTEIYSRVVGYYRPIQNWNRGKREEFAHRKTFNMSKADAHGETVSSVSCVCRVDVPEDRAVAASA